jgi:hypothetical protein
MSRSNLSDACLKSTVRQASQGWLDFRAGFSQKQGAPQAGQTAHLDAGGRATQKWRSRRCRPRATPLGYDGGRRLSGLANVRVDSVRIGELMALERTDLLPDGSPTVDESALERRASTTKNKKPRLVPLPVCSLREELDTHIASHQYQLRWPHPDGKISRDDDMHMRT